MLKYVKILDSLLPAMNSASVHKTKFLTSWEKEVQKERDRQTDRQTDRYPHPHGQWQKKSAR